MVKKFRIMHDSPLSDNPICIALAVVHTWGALITWTGGIEGCSIYSIAYDLSLIKEKVMVEVEEFTNTEQRVIDNTVNNAEKFIVKYREFEANKG